MTIFTLRAMRLASPLAALCLWMGAAQQAVGQATTTVTMQQNLDGYSGVRDTAWGVPTGGPDEHAFGNYGGNPEMRIWNNLSTPRLKGLVAFDDLSALPSQSSAIVSATLRVFQNDTTGGGNLMGWRLTNSWTEGTTNTVGPADENFVTVDGATRNHRNPIRIAADNWVNDTSPVGSLTETRVVNIGSGLDFDRAHHESRFTAPWSSQASIAAVESNEGSFFYDSAAGDLYFNPSDERFPQMGVGYYLNSDQWDAEGAIGALDIDQANPTTSPDALGGGWMSLDVTDFLKHWIDNPTENHGVLLGTTGATDIDIWSSEFDDATLGFTLGPQLIVEFTSADTAVPEPASIVLWLVLGLAAASFAYHRFRKIGSALPRCPAAAGN